MGSNPLQASLRVAVPSPRKKIFSFRERRRQCYRKRHLEINAHSVLLTLRYE